MPFDISRLICTLAKSAASEATKELTVGIVAQQLAGTRQQRDWLSLSRLYALIKTGAIERHLMETRFE